ncbi:Ig-like domain-containing protein [Gordonia sp. NPDC003950]
MIHYYAGTVEVVPTGVLTGSAAATDAEDDTVAFAITTQPAHGAVAIDPDTGDWVYTSATPGTFAADSFVITANDGHGGSTSQLVTIGGSTTV